jgi:hypothetical protein
VLATSDVDATNQSYYGEMKLHYLPGSAAKADLAAAVPLPKEGPVHDVQWSPKGGWLGRWIRGCAAGGSAGQPSPAHSRWCAVRIAPGAASAALPRPSLAARRSSFGCQRGGDPAAASGSCLLLLLRWAHAPIPSRPLHAALQATSSA